MPFLNWLLANGLDLGVIVSLLLAVRTMRKETLARQIGNRIALSDHRHSIWKDFHSQYLDHVLDPHASLEVTPLTWKERLFVTSLIVHLGNAHQATKAKMLTSMEGLHKDVREIFRLPIPKAVWDYSKDFQDKDFVEFVESCLAEPRAQRLPWITKTLRFIMQK